MISIPASTSAVHRTLVPYAPPGQLDSVTQARVDSIWKRRDDKVAGGEMRQGIILEDPASKLSEPVADNGSFGTSWVVLALLVLFCAVSLRFRNNYRYISVIFSDLVDVRERHNAFDDTVRETSFLLLLNILWCFSAGVMLYKALEWSSGYAAAAGFSFSIGDNPTLGTALCVGVMVAYALVMSLAYYIVGIVFSDRHQTKIWMKGYYASQGLSSVALFPLSILVVGYTPWTDGLLLSAGIVFILAKLIFIFKGFRIFFSQVSSWLLFLYYLCSLEIVPLVLVYIGAAVLCSTVL